MSLKLALWASLIKEDRGLNIIKSPESPSKVSSVTNTFSIKENIIYYRQLVTHQPNDPGVGGAPPCVFIATGGGVAQEGPAAIVTCGGGGIGI